MTSKYDDVVIDVGGAVVHKTPVMIRFDRDLLERVDAAAKLRGISRSAWVQYTVTGEG